MERDGWLFLKRWGAYPKGYCMDNSMYFQCLFKPVKGRNLSIPSFHCYWRRGAAWPLARIERQRFLVRLTNREAGQTATSSPTNAQ